MTRRIGMPPATLASKPIGRLRATARAKSSSPCSARSFLLAVTTGHGLDDDVNVVGGEEFTPACGDASAFGRVFWLDRLATADGGDDEMDSAALFDERSVLGDDVGRRATNGSEADNSYADVFHKKVTSD
jgi:hypothetical protein